MIDCLMQICFPYKVVTRHSADKPWVIDGFRLLVRKSPVTPGLRPHGDRAAFKKISQRRGNSV